MTTLSGAIDSCCWSLRQRSAISMRCTVTAAEEQQRATVRSRGSNNELEFARRSANHQRRLNIEQAVNERCHRHKLSRPSLTPVEYVFRVCLLGKRSFGQVNPPSLYPLRTRRSLARNRPLGSSRLQLSSRHHSDGHDVAAVLPQIGDFLQLRPPAQCMQAASLASRARRGAAVALLDSAFHWFASFF